LLLKCSLLMVLETLLGLRITRGNGRQVK